MLGLIGRQGPVLLPQHRVRVSFGTDTHDDLRVLRDLKAMAAFVVQAGLSEKVFVPAWQQTPTAATA